MNALIDIYHYSYLTFDAQAGVLTKYGRLLSLDDELEGSRLARYSLFDFFVEVSFRRDGTAQYIRVKETRDTESEFPIGFLHLN